MSEAKSADPLGGKCVGCGAERTRFSFEHLTTGTRWHLCEGCMQAIERESLSREERGIGRARAFLYGYAKGFVRAKGWDAGWLQGQEGEG